jgi:hypothetical protein
MLKDYLFVSTFHPIIFNLLVEWVEKNLDFFKDLNITIISKLKNVILFII